MIHHHETSRKCFKGALEDGISTCASRSSSFCPLASAPRKDFWLKGWADEWAKREPALQTNFGKHGLFLFFPAALEAFCVLAYGSVPREAGVRTYDST